MATTDTTTRVRPEHQQVKHCCARLYESDLVRFLLGDSFHPGGLQMSGQLGRMVGLNPDSRVLDVACGRGTTAVFLAKEFGCAILGVDYAEQNIETARLLAHEEHVEARVQFQRRGGRVGISDLTRVELLHKDLDGLLAWIACIGDAQTVERYAAYLHDAGFSVDSIEPKNEALEEMVDQVRLKLLGAEIMKGLKKLELPGVDLGAAKRMANSAMTAVKQGQLGYALLCATKQTQL